MIDSAENTPQSDSSNQSTLHQLVASLDRFSEMETETQLELVELKAGEVLFEQDDESDGMYIVIAGVLGVRVRHDDGTESEINRHAPGAIVGEMALVSGQKRSATVYAINDAGLFRLSQADYKKLVAEDAQVETLISESFDSRWQVIQLSEVLRDLIGDVDALTVQTWHEAMEWLRLSNGDIVFRQGEAPDGMYIVINGRLRVVATTRDGKEQVIAEITPGETVGEFAVLTGEPRSATVYAVRESTVVKIATETFHRLARVNPHFMTEITKIVVARQQRLLDQGKPPAPAALSVALVPTGHSADLDAFAHQLTQAMQPYGKCKTINAQEFDALFGKAGAAQSTKEDALDGLVADRLDELEANNAFVIYAAEATPTAWTHRCLGRADRVVIVADPAADPVPGAVEQLVTQFEIPVRTELVMWHSADTQQPTGTTRWLAERDVHAHHHVRQGDGRHMARLARRLTGHAIALVFSGGGALGFTEMGVYKALLELDIPFDYVGGTSMGAIMTGAIACGFSYNTFEEKAQLMADKGVMDITLPLASLTASKNVTELLQQMFGSFAIEDLWIPYFCVSCNYSLAEPVVHRRGSLWRAIRASMSVPGVFLPVVEDGNVLVDGGIMDNFPVETMVKLCEPHSVIGVVINPFKERKREYDYDTSLSGWKILWSRLNPFSKPLRTPSMLRTLTRASEINGIRTSRQQEALVDLMITPNVKGFSFTDYEKWRELAQVGYDAALEPLREWRAGQADL